MHVVLRPDCCEVKLDMASLSPGVGVQGDPEATQKFQEVGEAYMCLTQEGYDDSEDDDEDDSDDWEQEEGVDGRRRGFRRGGVTQVRKNLAWAARDSFGGWLEGLES